MGKIVGLGGGSFGNGEMQNVAEYIFSLAGKENPSFLFFPTASFDNTDENNDVITTFRNLGCKTEIMYLTDESQAKEYIYDKIVNTDIIYVDGGNLRFLMDTFRKTGADIALKRAFETGKVCAGLSSGMMCWFSEGWDDCDDGEYAFIDCLGLLPYSSCPHFESGRWPLYEQEIKGRKYSGFAMENGSAFCYIDGKTEIKCGNEGGMTYFFDKKKGHEKVAFGGEPQI